MKEQYNNRCEIVLDLISGKWKAHILYHLIRGPLRTSELKRLVTGISQKMLTEQLKELEQDGLVARKVYNEVPPRVEYSLAEHGESLKDMLKAVAEWGGNFIKHMSPNGDFIVNNFHTIRSFVIAKSTIKCPFFHHTASYK
ncbi:helix-turn-helix transcriptional regulator [Paenibacillus sp. SC116]|nr:helix-turn-helix domain-containing protein [Paenibacillus sp. SC116]MCR8843059.1 helix-turn-helix transcriptional regulator [Paenibacillus sp. SC116]